MKNTYFAGYSHWLTAILGILLLIGVPSLAAGESKFPKPSFNAKGELIRPDVRYREWVYVGTPVTPNSLNRPEAAFPEFHNVYIHPDDFDHWKNTGKFPDGTVMVKELVSVGATKATSGNGFFQGQFVGLEITIKDSKRFKNEPGYWAYFTFGHSYPLANTSKAFPTEACNACHESAAADDFVFTQYYPVLRAAKAARRARRVNYKKMERAMARNMASATRPTAQTPKVTSVIPTDHSVLFKYLQSRAYRKFAAKESAAHPSVGPHTKVGLPVRVFLGAKMAASLRAGNKAHPIGAGIVKEMFDASNKLQGWAVMVKTGDKSNGGKGWFWYEIVSTTDSSKPVAVGNGVTLCAGCHGIGKDFVLTKFPLR